MSDTNTIVRFFRDLLGSEQVIDDPERVKPYLADKWPRMLMAESPLLRDKIIVVMPQSCAAVQQVILGAGVYRVPVITRGGGSGVCGALRGSYETPITIVLSLERLSRVRFIDQASWTVEVEAGMLGGELERILGIAGMTLGHFPASLSISSVGGWIATRSSGQSSTRYGKIEQMIERVEVVLGNGEYLELDNSNSTLGPDLLPMLLGSEGTLGVITAVRLRTKPAVTRRIFSHYSFNHLVEGMGAVQAIAQSGLSPSIVRLYDGFDARHTLLSKSEAVAKLNWLKRKLLERDRLIVALSHLVDVWYKPHLIVVSEGNGQTESSVTEAEHKAVEEILHRHSAKTEKDLVAATWFEHRYNLSFEKLKHLVQNDCFVDTIDLFVPWKAMLETHQEISRMVSPVALLFAHISHITPQGACMYLTFVGRSAEGRLEIYDRIWHEVMTYCTSNGIGISDHHGVGVLKYEAFKKLRGQAWFKLFRAVKSYCDPNNILNPGHFHAE